MSLLLETRYAPKIVHVESGKAAPTRFAKEASRKDAGRFNGSQRCHKAFDVGPTKNWASHKYFLFPSVVLFLSLVFRVPLLLHTQFRRRHDSRRAPPP